MADTMQCLGCGKTTHKLCWKAGKCADCCDDGCACGYACGLGEVSEITEARYDNLCERAYLRSLELPQ